MRCRIKMYKKTVPGPIVQSSPISLSIPPKTLPAQTIPCSSLITAIVPILTNSCCSRENTTLGEHKLKKRLHHVSKLRRSDTQKLQNLCSQPNVQRITQIKYLNQEIKRKRMASSVKEAKIKQLQKQFSEKELSKKLKEKDEQLQHTKRAFNCLKTTNSATKLDSLKYSCDSVSFEEFQKVRKILMNEHLYTRLNFYLQKVHRQSSA